MPDELGPHLLGRIADPRHPRAASLFPAESVLPPRSTRTYRYWYQPTFLDQGNNGTCVGNAFAHRWADSPNSHKGIDEDWAIQLYIEATKLDPWSDNDGDLSAGTTGLAACQAMRVRGEIDEYRWITNGDDLTTAVLDVGSVAVGTDWLNSMWNPVGQYGNAYLQVTDDSGSAGGHEYLINGINIHPAYGPPFYRMKNSWGKGWGHGGTARFALDDLHHLIFDRGGDAVLINEIA